MTIDGKEIAERIIHKLRADVARLKNKPKLAVITCAPNFETQRFLDIKKRKAQEIGIELTYIELLETASGDECVRTIQKIAEASDGVVVQLPFPKHIDASQLIDAIPPSYDVDAFKFHDVEVLPPVVGAVQEILEQSHIDVRDKQAVVVGSGRLVGAPVAAWLRSKGARVEVVTERGGDIAPLTKDADILVLGAGRPGLIKPHMVKDGVVILDAGTSEAEGELRGDADPACAKKASLFTPVPGGIGPVTVAILLRNLVILASRKDADVL